MLSGHSLATSVQRLDCISSPCLERPRPRRWRLGIRWRVTARLGCLGGVGGLLLGLQLHWVGTVRGFANLLICFSCEPGTLEQVID